MPLSAPATPRVQPLGWLFCGLGCDPMACTVTCGLDSLPNPLTTPGLMTPDSPGLAPASQGSSDLPVAQPRSPCGAIFYRLTLIVDDVPLGPGAQCALRESVPSHSVHVRLGP